MADTILSGRWIIHYDADNRQKRLERDTAITPTTIDTVNQLYSALQDHFDELTQMDDGVPMSAQTPTEYTIGVIDAGDKDAWFIDRTSVQYLKGGAIKTASWKRNPLVGNGTGTTGIIRIKYTATTNLDATDIGRDILMTTDADRGTILDFNDTGSAKLMWIRPDSNAAANSFDNSLTDGGAFTIPDESLGQVWQVVAAGPTYVDETADANEGTANDWTIFPAGAAADYATIGFRQKFKKFVMNVGTAGTGTYVVTWQYWNGAWTALSGVSDGTTSFKTAGTNNVTFTVPTDWVATSINGSASLYYIRALKDTGTVTLAPLGTQGFIGSTGATLAQVNIAGGGSAVTGESLWANVFTLGTIETNTHIYINQNSAVLNSYKDSTQDWWGDGQIDILVNVKEIDLESDEGVVQVFARQHSKTYDHFEVDLTPGGRNPIPLSTGNDLDNQVGYRQMVLTDSGGTFTAGDIIRDNSDSTIQGIVTSVSGTNPNVTLQYYLFGDPLNDFTAGTGAFAGVSPSTGTGTAVAPSNVNAAADTDITVNMGGNSTFDINENDTTENYSMVVNCNSKSLTKVQQRVKFLTRRGETTDLDDSTAIIAGQFYIGADRRIIYDTLTGTLAQGDVVTQLNSSAKGTVVAHFTTPKILILRNSRGTFTNLVADEIRKDASNKVTMLNTSATSATVIAPVKASPFGTFAGGKFFGAPGVVLSNVASADASNYQLIDDSGNVVKPPTKVTITVGNTKLNDKVAVFRLTGALGTIKKDKYNATAQAAGLTTALMGSAIAVDEPGKTAGGILRLVDASASREYRIRFTSWTASTFTLHNYSFTTLTTGTNSTTLVTTSTEFTNAKIGDLVYNSTRTAYSYIVTIAGDNLSATISPAITSQVSTDTIKLNVLPVATTTTPQDTWYVPLIDSFETADGSETATVTYSADIPALVRARRITATAILPFEQESTVTTTGMTVSVIRTSDTIFNQPV